MTSLPLGPLLERFRMRGTEGQKMELYQFPMSHFCEKARWALDHKGAAYRIVNLLPVFHFAAVRRIAPRSSVPVLRDGKTVIQGSGEIIDYLERKYPEPPLTPRDSKTASETVEWERFLDEEVGVQARAWFYFHTLASRRAALNFLLQDAPLYKRAGFGLAFPFVRVAMLRYMNITAEAAAVSEERFRRALERLERALDGRRFLVEDRFSRADLVACALMSPVCLADDAEAAARFPGAVLAFREEVKAGRVYAWVREVYAEWRNVASTREA
jgi:glutathione S-transferase